MAKKEDEQYNEPWRNEENEWYQQARRTAETLLNRPAFSYDPEKDPLYQTAKNQYARLGKRAMEDTMGKAAALSGGYASSYAQTLGANAYDAQLARVAELLPDYYERARSAYERETGELQDALGTAIGLYDKDYQTWLDNQKADRWEQEFADDRNRWEAELAMDAEKWAAQQAASAASQSRSDQANARSYAYRMAMTALQQGLSVSDSLLKTAGIDKAYADMIRKYYYNLRRR